MYICIYIYIYIYVCVCVYIYIYNSLSAGGYEAALDGRHASSRPIPLHYTALRNLLIDVGPLASGLSFYPEAGLSHLGAGLSRVPPPSEKGTT